MARRRSEAARELEASLQIDLTPLIDVTFQLLVFVLVANDLTHKEHEPVELPVAVHGDELTSTPNTLVVHVLRPERPGVTEGDLRVRVHGQDHSLASLGRLFRLAADRNRPAGPGKASDVRVHVRADSGAPWLHVQWVLQECAGEGVGIYRVQFATESLQPDPSRLRLSR